MPIRAIGKRAPPPPNIMKFVFSSFVLSGFVLSGFIFSLAGAIVRPVVLLEDMAIVLGCSVDLGDGLIEEEGFRAIAAFGGWRCTQAINTRTIEPGRNNLNDRPKQRHIMRAP